MQPVIVVIRHPDFETEVQLFGVEAQVIDIDMGAGFDAGSLHSDDLPQVKEWAEHLQGEVARLPTDHPARQSVEEVCHTLLERFDQ
jgi:hypothetical protein